MLKTGLALIGLALLVLGFAGGMYYERELVPRESEPVVIPPYEPRMLASAPPPGAADAGLGAERARQALREILMERDPYVRAERLARQVTQLGPADVPAIKPVLEDRHLDLDNPDYALLVRFWAQHDHEAAARWAAFASPSSFRTTAVYPAVEEMARRDPNLAMILLAELELYPNPYSAIAQVALVRGWFESGIEGLEEYIYALGVGPSQQRAMAAFARRAIMLGQTDELMRWATTLPDQDDMFKIMVFRQIGSELAQLDAAAAAAWCEAVCEGPFGSSVRTLVAQRWAAQDGRAAMEWVSKAPEGRERDWAVEGAQRGWMQERPEEFDAWLNEVTKNGTQIERWIAPVVAAYPSFVARDPERLEEALAWASRIEDPEKRWRAHVTVARVWRKRDPEAADAWIDQSELDEKGRAAARNIDLPDDPSEQEAAPETGEPDTSKPAAPGAEGSADDAATPAES